MLKFVNYVAFRAVLPYECDIGPDVYLWHRGLGVVVHPNVALGARVHLGHGVTIAGTGNGPPTLIADDAKIGAHAMVLVESTSRSRVRVGVGAVVGAGAIVTKDVPDGAVVVGNPAKETSSSRERR